MKRMFLFPAGRTGKTLFHTRRIRIKRNMPAAFAAGVVFCLIIFLLFQLMTKTDPGNETVIVLTAESYTLEAGENVPELKASADIAEGTEESEKDKMLSKEAGYRVRDLMEDLNEGDGYEVECNADGKETGEFPVTIRLSGELESSLSSEWKGKVEIQLRSGVVTVKSSEGEKSIDK